MEDLQEGHMTNHAEENHKLYLSFYSWKITVKSAYLLRFQVDVYFDVK